MKCRLFRRKPPPTSLHAAPPGPSKEALREAEELERMKPRVERVVRERERLLGENNYAARIAAIYQGER